MSPQASKPHSKTTAGKFASRLSVVALSAALVSGSAHAEDSAWSRLAKMISPNAASRPAPKTVPAGQTYNAAPGAQPEVADEASTQQVASLDQNNALPLSGDGSTPADGQQYANAGKQIDLGLESEDDGAKFATSLFKNPDILRLMGDKPRFRYDAKGKPDPMVVPWVRSAAIFNELNTQAEEMLKSNQLDKATALYKRILDLKDARFQAQAVAKLNEIMNMKNEMARQVLAAQGAAVVEAPVELPVWVADNTTAVIVSKGKEMCLVGDNMLAVGDPVPNYPDVHVASISDNLVQYQIKNKTFDVPLNSR